MVLSIVTQLTTLFLGPFMVALPPVHPPGIARAETLYLSLPLFVDHRVLFMTPLPEHRQQREHGYDEDGRP
jgi:hypothetical protein